MNTSELVVEVERVLVPYLVDVGCMLIGATILWVVGGWVINLIGRLSHDGMTACQVAPTLINLGDSSIKLVLHIVRMWRGWPVPAPHQVMHSLPK